MRCLLYSPTPQGVLADPAALTAMSLTEASLTNHGALFHELIVEPIMSALMGDRSRSILASLRHKVWAPLYWPTTLWEAAVGLTPAFNPQRQFWADSRGGMTELVDELLSRTDASSLVTRRDVGALRTVLPHNGGTAFAFAGRDGKLGEWVEIDRPIVSMTPSQLFAAAEIEHHADRIHARVAWVDVPEAEVQHLSATTFLDTDDGVFRVSGGPARFTDDGSERRLFTVELRHDATDTAPIAEAMCAAGIVDHRDHVALVDTRTFPAMAEPTAVNQRRFVAAHDAFVEAHPGVRLLGPVGGYGADPMNEQLFSGVATAMEVTGAHT